MSDTSKVDLQTGLSEKNLQEMVKKFEKYEEIFTVKLFGSRATAQYKLASDVDLCIFGEDVTSRTVARLKDDLEEETTIPYFFDVVNYQSVTTDALKHNIDKEGKIIYRRGWKEVTLGEVVEVNISSYSSNDSWEFVNYLDTGNITENNISEIKLFNLKNDKLPSRAKRKVINGDILYSTVRPNQKHYGIMKNILDNMLVSTGFVVITEKNFLSHNYFIYYFLIQDLTINFLQAMAEQQVSTYPSIKPSHLKDLTIHLPPLPEQKAIARTLSCLDDKIELNNKMNKTLEEMAQALYKRWFVDFEFPNADGLPYKSSGGEMVQSELGLIPKGWEVGKLGDCIKFVKGKKPNIIKISNFENSKLYLTIDVIKGSANLYCRCENMINVVEKDILMLMDGASSGNIYTGLIGIVSSTMSKLELINKNIEEIMIYQILKFHNTNIKKNITGSAIPHVDKEYINRISFCLPIENKLLNIFVCVSNYIKNSIYTNTTQTQTLTNIRNALLPKLMAGEIRVPFDKDML